MKKYIAYEMNEELERIGTCSNFTSAVVNFEVNGYESMRKRKTVTEADKRAYEMLKEMVKELEKKIEG